MSKIEESVINKIRERADIGKNKYGLTHLQEELIDAAVYLEKVIQSDEYRGDKN